MYQYESTPNPSHHKGQSAVAAVRYSQGMPVVLLLLYIMAHVISAPAVYISIMSIPHSKLAMQVQPLLEPARFQGSAICPPAETPPHQPSDPLWAQFSTNHKIEVFCVSPALAGAPVVF